MASAHATLVSALRAYIHALDCHASGVLPTPEELRDHERETPSLANDRPCYMTIPRLEVHSSSTLELLALMNVLAHLDREAWMEEALKFWYNIDNYDYFTKPFTAGVHLSLPGLAGLSDARMPPPSPECVALLQRVQDEASDLVDVVDCCQVPLQILVYCQVWAIKYDKTTTAELQEILDYAKVFKKTLADQTRTSPSFLVREIAFHESFGLHTEKQMLNVVHQLAECGVTLRDFGSISSEPSKMVLDTLHLLMPTRPTALGSGTRSVVVHGPRFAACAPAILSAVQHSRSVNRVTVSHRHNYDDLVPTQAWRWVAYALFSSHASHQVRIFEIDEETTFTEEDVEAMREVIESEDPLAVVLGETPGSSVGTVFVKASRFYLNDVETADDSIITSKKPLICRGYKKVNSGWRVLVPGLGVAVVREEDGEFVPAPVTPSLPRLEIVANTLDPSDGSWSALLKLLSDRIRAVRVHRLGPWNEDTESESEYESDEEDDDEDEDEYNDDEESEDPQDEGDDVEEMDAFARLMRLCPRMQELTVEQGSVRNFNVFTKHASMASGPRLRKLELTKRIKDDTSLPGLFKFFKVLADATHPLSRSLEYLSLRFRLPRRHCVRLSTVISEMLDRNRRLHSIYVDFRLPCGDDEVDSAFNAHEDDNVMIVSNSIDLRSKLALLGALSLNQVATRLDSNVFATIFAFAAPSRPRNIRYYCGDNY